MFKAEGCCGNENKISNCQVRPMSGQMLKPIGGGTNICAGKKPIDGNVVGDGYFKNINCTLDTGVVQALEQSGIDVTKGYKGLINTTGRDPITDPYWKAGLCPVNVHWHLGAEHRSAGQYDESGKVKPDHRRLAAGKKVRKGFSCYHYDSNKK